MKKVRKAVEATYTYLQHDGDDAAMQDNLDYYKSREDFREDMLVDLEVTPVMEAYQKGSRSNNVDLLCLNRNVIPQSAA